MEGSDSRKRPLDVSPEFGVSKKSNSGNPYISGSYSSFDECDYFQAIKREKVDNIHLKVLVPSIAAGGIIGKGGEAILEIQKESGAMVKMSKSNDFYPGTMERVCLVIGTMEAVKKVHNFIMEKIRERPDQYARTDVDDKFGERHKQVKVLVPNTTAGMIIGKNGVQVKEIKEKTGAYIQLSQKSREMSLPERCITIAAGAVEQCQEAVDMILEKIRDDPLSGSYDNISYSDYRGPVASAKPTGSPFAVPPPVGHDHGPPPPIVSNIGSGLNNLKLNQGGFGGLTPHDVDTMRMTLRSRGYIDHAVDEITGAVLTLANYGLFGFGVNLGGLGLQSGANMNLMGSLASMLGGGSAYSHGSMYGGSDRGSLPSTPRHSSNDLGIGALGASSSESLAKGFGAVGKGNTSSDAVGLSDQAGNGTGGDNILGLSGAGQLASGGQGFQGPNLNSFGLGPGAGGSGLTGSPGISTDDGSVTSKDMEVGEHIVGAILGQGGRGIVEIQTYSGATVQISKKGVFAPGTKNRIVTISGSAASINMAESLIQQRIMLEEAKRARQTFR